MNISLTKANSFYRATCKFIEHFGKKNIRKAINAQLKFKSLGTLKPGKYLK